MAPDRLLLEGGIVAALLTLLGYNSKRQDRLKKEIEKMVPRTECRLEHHRQTQILSQFREDNKEQHKDIKEDMIYIRDRLDTICK